jgi:hypothetical protein
MKSKTNARRVPTRFSRPTRFTLEPTFGALRAQRQKAFEDLKSRLVPSVLEDVAEPGVQRQLRLAANEAAAIAWLTPFPLLVFPVLLEEKAAEVQQYALRQEEVQAASDVFAGCAG